MRTEPKRNTAQQEVARERCELDAEGQKEMTRRFEETARKLVEVIGVTEMNKRREITLTTPDGRELACVCEINSTSVAGVRLAKVTLAFSGDDRPQEEISVLWGQKNSSGKGYFQNTQAVRLETITFHVVKEDMRDRSSGHPIELQLGFDQDFDDNSEREHQLGIYPDGESLKTFDDGWRRSDMYGEAKASLANEKRIGSYLDVITESVNQLI